jgi:hypothetical protein
MNINISDSFQCVPEILLKQVGPEARYETISSDTYAFLDGKAIPKKYITTQDDGLFLWLETKVLIVMVS